MILVYFVYINPTKLCPNFWKIKLFMKSFQMNSSDTFKVFITNLKINTKNNFKSSYLKCQPWKLIFNILPQYFFDFWFIFIYANWQIMIFSTKKNFDVLINHTVIIYCSKSIHLYQTPQLRGIWAYTEESVCIQ